MEYTTEEKRKADLEIKELIASGKYIQQDMRIIDNIYDVELTNETKRLLSNVLFSYLEYLESLKKVDVESLEEYLKLCKNADILDNQKLEKEDLSKSKIKNNNLDWVKEIKKIGKLTNINRNIVNEFIDTIYVNDDRTIKINLRYKDQYEDALKYLKKQNNMI